jgi:ABC-type lipoprotein release transport system permease subunit
VATGVRFAFERRSGGRTVPVRTAFAALAVAVAGAAAASVVATSFARLAHQPARWGWNWSSEPDYFGNGDEATVAGRLARDGRVAGVGVLDSSSVGVNGIQTNASAMRSFKGDMALTLRDGRLPATASEVALGQSTLDRAKAHIGDTVHVQSPDGTPPRSSTVVGTVVFRSQSETPVLDDGVAFTPAGLASVIKNQTDIESSLELRYPPGADVASLDAALTKDYGLQFNAFTAPQVPGVIRNLAEARTVAIALALFFAVLGTLALGHTLVVGTGGRRGQLAVLRTLGFRPTQVRGAVAVQACVLALAATAIGLPLGVALGRYVWHALTADLGALDGPATPWIVVAAAIPLTMLAASALAAWPARAASRARIADALHVE